ncbi:MAG: hypothetical protein JNG84_05345 [Archangium sp.]|nr:hypothetical protein [Archangium sp.]
MRALSLGLALVSASAAWGQVFTYNYLQYRMMSSRAQPFPFFVDGRTAPSGLVPATVQAASEAAWATWNNVECASPKVVSRGLTGTAVVNPADSLDTNSVTPVVMTSLSDPDYQRALGSEFIAGITIPLSQAGVLISCDIFLNAVRFGFSTGTPTPNNAVDIESLMLHEAGHCLGIDHTGLTHPYPGNVMDGVIAQGSQLRTLGAWDIGALCERNPATGAVGAPCLADGGCDPSNTCVTQTVGTSPAARFCSRSCNASANEACPLPLVCTSAQLDGGACLLPDHNVTQVGKACAQPSDCQSALALCNTPTPSPSSNTWWVQGYCTQGCEAGQPPCPAGSTCTVMGDATRRCLASCRAGLADCRASYSCVQTAAGGVCAPKCFTDADCGDSSFECRACDGLCVAKQSATGQLGDVCASEATCGTGQACTPLIAGVSTKQCAQPCGVGCGTCPTGGSCQSTAAGFFCLRQCSGVGSCPSGLRCGDLATGKGCVPACQRDLDCPVGEACEGGECRTPSTCGALCATGGGAGGGGGGAVAPRPDAGTGVGPRAAGCGCQTKSGADGVLLVVLAVLVMRRREWHRQ